MAPASEYFRIKFLLKYTMVVACLCIISRPQAAGRINNMAIIHADGVCSFFLS